MYNTHPVHLQNTFDAQAQAGADRRKEMAVPQRRRGLRNLLHQLFVRLHWISPLPMRHLP